MDASSQLTGKANEALLGHSMVMVSLLQTGRWPAGAGRRAVMLTAAQSLHHVLHVIDKPVQRLRSCVLLAFLHVCLQCGQPFHLRAYFGFSIVLFSVGMAESWAQNASIHCKGEP